jgi:hypothetical protein
MVAPQLSACRCGGTGIITDDGSVTDMPGWPLPCPCTDSVPRQVRTLMRQVQAQRVIIHHVSPASPDHHPYPSHMAQSALLAVPLSRSGL